jgi:hypothetical protein
MPVLTKINTNALSDSAVTSAKVAGDVIAAGDLAPNSVDSSELVNGAVDLSHMSVNSVDSDQYVDGSIDNAHLADDAVTGANIAYLGDGSGNLSGTITNQQLHFGTAFTLTDNLTVNGDLTLAKVRTDGTGQSITGSGRTLTGTGTLRMGAYLT